MSPRKEVAPRRTQSTEVRGAFVWDFDASPDGGGPRETESTNARVVAESPDNNLGVTCHHVEHARWYTDAIIRSS